MYQVKRECLVCELKGLLNGLENKAIDARYNLSVNTLESLSDNLLLMEQYIHQMWHRLGEYDLSISEELS
jgi:hypothetical protein